MLNQKNNEFEPAEPITKEKRPQDWTQEERLNIVIECGSLSEAAVSERCRSQGLYPYHLKQWKEDFSTETSMNTETKKTDRNKKITQ